ncbi:hypothetical protein [Citrobacter freundii]|uniref:Uncharacterized protein n=1 Tax=Citrobacter freundii TaxID=546 RepID=A0AAN4JDP1_CITFR|nr:hypothetical protein [Salmonella enterica]EKU4669577.1 hypothetical protein [Citrobacter freundii]EKW2108029.1 hypothetical protein [Citrobacter freundii]ELP5616082.1 hypothetical protein [Salmonella enterica]HCE9103594.1 hypothetical protein [Citrobacter freundii]
MQINDVSKLEKIITNIAKDDGVYTSKTSCFIGRTASKVIVISALSLNEFESEFNEDPDDVPDMHFVLGE